MDLTVIPQDAVYHAACPGQARTASCKLRTEEFRKSGRCPAEHRVTDIEQNAQSVNSNRTSWCWHSHESRSGYSTGCRFFSDIPQVSNIQQDSAFQIPTHQRTVSVRYFTPRTPNAGYPAEGGGVSGIEQRIVPFPSSTESISDVRQPKSYNV